MKQKTLGEVKKKHIKIIPETERKKAHRYFPPKSNVTLSFLRESFNKVYESSIKKKDIYDDDSIYFIIQFTTDPSSLSIREIIKKLDIQVLSLISNNSIKATILKINKDNFLDKVKKYTSHINSIREVNLEDKVDDRILKFFSEGKEETIKASIKFEPGFDREKYRVLTKSVSSYLEKDKISNTISEFIGDKNATMSVKVSLSSLKEVVKEVDSISKVEKIPEIRLSSQKNLHVQKCSIRNDGGSQKTINLPTVCILDSGINELHPKLNGFIISKQDFIDELRNSCMDNNGHGTKIAGKVIYQEEFPCNTPKANVIMIKAFDNETFELDDVNSIIHKVLEKYHNVTRVFNLSFNSDEPIENYREQLDRLAYEFNVLFVVSSGNIFDEEIIRELNSSNLYPYYIKNFPINFPGDCFNALTVGSHTDENSNITSKLSPSPFTRSGSILERIKPDAIASGGNQNTVISNGQISSLSHLGVKVCDFNFSNTGNLYTESCGSSFSAPLISSLAARLFQEYPDSSAELVKALIINSCIPLRSQVGEEYDTDIQGHGKCIFDDAIFSSNWKVTLFSDQVLTYSEVEDKSFKNKKIEKVFKVPIPKGTTKLIVTLVFGNPSIEQFRGFMPIKFNFSCKKLSSLHFRSPSKKYFKKRDNVICKTYSLKRSYGLWEIRVKPNLKMLTQRYDVRYAVVITLINENQDIPLLQEVTKDLHNLKS